MPNFVTKKLIISLVGGFVLGFIILLSSPSSTLAAITSSSQLSDACVNSSGGSACTAEENAYLSSLDTVESQTALREAVAQRTRDAVSATRNGTTGCSFSPSTWDLCLSNVIYVFTVGIGSTFAFIGAYFFNIAVSLALNSLAYAQGFISQGWTMARDLANMGFILALVYIAYTVLLRAESGGTMRMLAWVIVMALIINFSFFFTRLVIDAGNILAVQFYNAVPTDGRTLADTLGDTRGGSTINSTSQFLTSNNKTFERTKDLTHPIMNGLNMQGLFSTAIFDKWYKDQNRGVGGGINVFLTLSFIYIAVGAMYFILAVMFLAAGIKFLARIVVLWFLIVASPLAFLAKTTSLSSKYYDLWQRYLITHTFYPVIFLFIFLFISLVMKDLNPTGAAGGLTQSIISDLSDLNTGNTASAISIIAASIANVAIRLGFVVAMLYIGMRAADKVGVMGATAAGTFTNWVSRKGTGAFFGGSAWAMRNSIGAAANSAYNSRGLKELASRNRFIGGGLWRGAGALSKKSFDVRNIESARKGLGKIGVDTNAGATGGYAKSYSDRITKRVSEANKLKPTDRQTQKAQEEALKQMAPVDKMHLQAAEENYARDQARFDSGEISERDLKKAKKRYDDELKPLLDNAKKLAGSGNVSNYANSIDIMSKQNLYGATGHFPVPGWISAADAEAAAQLRAPKEEADRLRSLIKNATTPPLSGGGPGGGGPGGGGPGGGPGGGRGPGGGPSPSGAPASASPTPPTTPTPAIAGTAVPSSTPSGATTHAASTISGETAVRRVLDEMRAEVTPSDRSAPLPLNEVASRPNAPEVKSYVDNKASTPDFAETPKVALDDKSLDTLRGLQSGLKEVVKSTEKTAQHIASTPQQTIPKAQKLPEQGNIGVDQNQLNNAANDNIPPSENRNVA